MHHGFTVGYHGCDKAVGQAVLLGDQTLDPKTNPWDWLGTGIYFWENSPQRALEFAQEKAERGWGDNPINDPWVIGANIHLGNCFDLTDRQAVAQLPQFHDLFVQYLTDAGTPVPENKSIPGEPHNDLVLRNLDCGVINFAMDQFDKQAPGDAFYYQTVRGVFVEGDPIYPNARINEKTHVQLAVRDPGCIMGYFRPTW